MRDEVHAPLGPRGRDDQFTPGVVERTHHRDLLSLPRRRNPQVGAGKGRVRRIAIVALARKLLVALWRYVTQGVVPEGAVFKAA